MDDEPCNRVVADRLDDLAVGVEIDVELHDRGVSHAASPFDSDVLYWLELILYRYAEICQEDVRVRQARSAGQGDEDDDPRCRAPAVLDEWYVAVTIQAVADEAGVAVQTVYAVFGNKRELLRQVLDLR